MLLSLFLSMLPLMIPSSHFSSSMCSLAHPPLSLYIYIYLSLSLSLSLCQPTSGKFIIDIPLCNSHIFKLLYLCNSHMFILLYLSLSLTSLVMHFQVGLFTKLFHSLSSYLIISLTCHSHILSVLEAMLIGASRSLPTWRLALFHLE